MVTRVGGNTSIIFCDNLWEEGERTRVARICADFLLNRLNRLNLCEGVGEGWGCNRLHYFFWGRGGGVLEVEGICL